MNINLTPIIEALILLLAALITYRVIPWVKARTTKEQQANLDALIRTLVFAAEQLYGAGNGPEKLQYVCNELRERGFEVDLAKVEAAVYKAFNSDVLRLGSAISLPNEDDSGVDVNISHWSLEQLREFCLFNEIPAEGCVTREDYMDAIEHGGRVSNEPPSDAPVPAEEPFEEPFEDPAL